MWTRETTKLRVLLTCRPVILNRVLADLLRGHPEFELVEPSTEIVDVVITTGDDSGNLFDDPSVDPKRARVLVAVDRRRNTLYIRRTGKGSVGIEMLPGEVPVLLNLLNREVALQRRSQVDSWIA